MRLCTALVLAALVALPAAAQVHVESEDGRVIVRIEDGEVIIEEGDADDVRVHRFSIGDEMRGPRRHARALRLRLDSLDLKLPKLDGLAELEHLAELEALRDLEFHFDHDFGDRMPPVFALGDRLALGAWGVSPELRREVRERERALEELARRTRRAEGEERKRLEREMDRALEEQFALRQRVRREALDGQRERLERQREHLERQRERLEEQAEALRERAEEIEARDDKRPDVIRERRQELLGGDRDVW